MSTIITNKFSRILTVIIASILFASLAIQPAAAYGSNGLFDCDEFFAVVGDQRAGSISEDGYQKIPFVANSAASYTCVSSNPKVATCAVTNDTYTFNGLPSGWVKITGISTGTTNVTLKQTISGKTKNVGTIKIIVEGVYLTARGNYKHEFGLGIQDSSLWIKNRNSNATYSFVVDKPGMTLTDTKDSDGYQYVSLNATSYGTYKVSAYENLNGISRKMKDMTFTVNPTTIHKNITLNVVDNSDLPAIFALDYPDMNYCYGYWIPDNEAANFYQVGGYGINSWNEEIRVTTSDQFAVYTVATERVKGSADIIMADGKTGTCSVDFYRWPISQGKSEDTMKPEYYGTIKVTVINQEVK